LESAEGRESSSEESPYSWTIILKEWGSLARARTNVYLSPGLGALLNGSTSKMRRRTYNELPVVKVEDHQCRIVRKNNKTIALFTDENLTGFQIACEVLSSMARRGPKK
jgi:hypothetical protein